MVDQTLDASGDDANIVDLASSIILDLALLLEEPDPRKIVMRRKWNRGR
jgi:hypothetical protein